MKFVEAHAHKKEKRDRKPELDHLRVSRNKQANAHVVEHHHTDGSVSKYEFDHPRQNRDALHHVAEHLGMETGDESERDER